MFSNCQTYHFQSRSKNYYLWSRLDSSDLYGVRDTSYIIITDISLAYLSGVGSDSAEIVEEEECLFFTGVTTLSSLTAISFTLWGTTREKEGPDEGGDEGEIVDVATVVCGVCPPSADVTIVGDADGGEDVCLSSTDVTTVGDVEDGVTTGEDVCTLSAVTTVGGVTTGEDACSSADVTTVGGVTIGEDVCSSSSPPSVGSSISIAAGDWLFSGVSLMLSLCAGVG